MNAVMGGLPVVTILVLSAVVSACRLDEEHHRPIVFAAWRIDSMVATLEAFSSQSSLIEDVPEYVHLKMTPIRAGDLNAWHGRSVAPIAYTRGIIERLECEAAPCCKQYLASDSQAPFVEVLNVARSDRIETVVVFYRVFVRGFCREAEPVAYQERVIPGEDAVWAELADADGVVAAVVVPTSFSVEHRESTIRRIRTAVRRRSL